MGKEEGTQFHMNFLLIGFYVCDLPSKRNSNYTPPRIPSHSQTESCKAGLNRRKSD